MEEINGLMPEGNVEYTEDNIRHLDDMEHIRVRSGMYIGRLGDGTQNDDGIYVLLKEVMDNSIDEFKMGAGKRIEISIEENLRVSVRDYGRGIPQGKLIEAVSKLNTGGKYDSKAFKKSVGLNGVGIKAVNALSNRFEVRSYREGKVRIAIFEKGILQSDVTENSDEESGTYIFFEPDSTLFLNYSFQANFVEMLLRNYTYLNTGLSIIYNGQRIISRHGLEDLLNDNMTAQGLYNIIHLKGEDIEIAFTHTNQYGEEYYSFVNGQHTTQGGTHQSALKEHIARTIKEFYNKNQEYADIRNGIVAAIAINVEEPQFEGQTKTKLGSPSMSPGGVSVNKYVGDFIKTEVDNYLHKNPLVAEVMLQKIQDSEKERKAIAGVTKLARERAKKANLHNRKLRDCRYHLNDGKGKDQETESCIFITEGDSASGSITKSRDVNTQAVFSLRGKPLNSYGLTKKVVYENEEFNLLQAALNIEDGIEGLRYNKVIAATDADVDEIHRTYGAGYSFIDKRMDNSNTLSVYYCVWLFLYGFLVLIALITVFNIINSIAMSVAARTEQYGAFRAIGLSNRQLSKMIAAEAFTYAAIGSVAGLCFGLLCNKFLFTILVSRQWGDPWAIPWPKIGIIILIVLVSVAIAIHRPTKRIHNMSIVETINIQ